MTPNGSLLSAMEARSGQAARPTVEMPMKRVPSRYLIRPLICAGAVLLLFSCARNETRSLSNELDRMLERKEEFETEKENRIARLREWLNVPGISPEQEYEINAGLCEEFSKYRSDSAIRYVKRNLSLAQRMNDRPKYLASELQLARLYSFLGRSVEANRLLCSIRAEELPSDLLPVYYRAWSNYYQHYASLSNQSGYLQEREAYRDSLLMTADPESFRYKLSRSYVLMQDGRLDEAQALLARLLDEVEKDSPDYAEAAYAMGRLFMYRNDRGREKKYYILSAIADLKNATKENASFQTLAITYYNDGDLTRAYRYTQAAIEDALSSNIQFRTAWMSEFYSIISAAHQAREAKVKFRLQHYLLLISVLSLVLIFLFLYVAKQMRRLYRVKEELSQANDLLRRLNDELNEKNAQLLGANEVKEQYIARFFDFCSTYIDKMEDYRRSLKKLFQDRRFDDLNKRLKSTSMFENELDELYKNFDAIFLSLYPTFVEDFNALLIEEERIVPKSGDLLNKELRIYALLRLGITDSMKIASFLRCSLSTVYSYRTKVRNKAAVPKEEFEKEVMEIGTVRNTDG